MSIYEQGRAAYRARIALEQARHWPTARRESWQRGWLDEQREDGQRQLGRAQR